MSVPKTDALPLGYTPESRALKEDSLERSDEVLLEYICTKRFFSNLVMRILSS